MDILTPEKLKDLKEAVKQFVSALEKQNLKNMDIDEQYDCVLRQVEACNWTCSAVKAQYKGTEQLKGMDIDVIGIYVNIGYGCYIYVYLDEEHFELPSVISWADLPILSQNSFIGTHLDYYAQANRFDIIKREDNLHG